MNQTSNLFYQSRQPRPQLERAEGIYLWDVHGKRYLDGSSGAMVSNIGHSNPAVLQAMLQQMEKATFGYRLHFQNEPAERLAAKTAGYAPGDLNKVFFVSGGSEAVESAIKLARHYALATGQGKRWKVISHAPSYHGATLGALALTHYGPLTDPFTPMMKAMPSIPAPRAYLDRLAPDAPETAAHYAENLEAEILRQGADSVLAMIVEPVGGASTGALVPPADYLRRVQAICQRYGILLIHDEVMTGGGRTGRFFAAEHWDIQPDLIAISKGFGAGYVPLGAVVARDHMVDVILDQGGFPHGFTYAGNPLACTAGLAVIEQLENLELFANAEQMGALLKQRLQELATRYPIIGDVRGKGLLLAFELVANRDTMEPLPKTLNVFQRLVEIAYAKGLVIYARRSRGGVEGEHFLVCPPLIVTAQQIDEIIVMLEASLQELLHSLPAGAWHE